VNITYLHQEHINLELAAVRDAAHERTAAGDAGDDSATAAVTIQPDQGGSVHDIGGGRLWVTMVVAGMIDVCRGRYV
jgi:hypothetical protein